MKKLIVTLVMIGVAIGISSCKRTNVADPGGDGPPGFSILLEGIASPNVLLVDGVRHVSFIQVRARDANNNPVAGKAVLFLQSNGSAQLEWGVFENMASTIMKVTGSDGIATATFYGPTTLVGTQLYILAQMTVDGSSVPKEAYITMYLSRPGSQNSAPVVNISAPIANSTVSGTIPIVAQAADESGLAAVDCYVDGASIGSQTATTANTYTFKMDCSKYNNSNHTIEVVAFDKQGLRGADTVSVNINNQNPQVTVAITAPAPNATVNGADVSIIATAFASTSISRVDCLIDNNIIGTLATGVNNTYTFTWNSSLVANGIHAIKVTAFDDAGLSASAAINVTVNNGSSGPTVDITSPVNNAVVDGAVSIKALAKSDYGIDQVDCYVDGGLVDSKPGVTTSDIYTFTWDSTQLNNGRHTIMVTAVDKKGISASNSVSVTVSNTDEVPKVEIIYPSDASTIDVTLIGGKYTLTIKANATDDRGINKVQLYIDDILQVPQMGKKGGTLYEYIWSSVITAAHGPNALTVGPHTLYVIAYDTSNQATISDSVTVTITLLP